MIELLANIQPVVLIVLLVALYGVENLYPYLTKPVNRKRQDRRNFIIALISFVLNAVLGTGVVMVVELTGQHHWGLLNLVALPETVKVILGVLLLDLASYATHNLQHKVPLLWRFHRIHHSDLHLSTSSSLRFHPVETVYVLGIAQCLSVILLGVSLTSFVIYGTIALPLLILQHSNVRLPNWIEKYGRLILATPGWHKIHHAADQAQTDSHYGDVFTFWDRIFGTWGHFQPHEIRYGLDEFNTDERQTIGYLMKAPFLKKNK